MAVKGGGCPGCGGPGDSGEMLYKRGFVTRAELDEAQRASDDPVQWLYDRGTIGERAYHSLRAMRLGLAFTDLERVIVDAFPLSMERAKALGALPVKRDGDNLWVAFKDPEDRDAIRRVEEETGLRVHPVVAPPSRIDAVTERLDANPSLQRSPDRDPGEMLVLKELVTEGQLAAARAASDDPVRWLLDYDIIGEHEFAMARAWEHRMVYFGFSDGSFRNRVPERVPTSLARELGILPLGLRDDVLRIAISDPRDWALVGRAEQATGLKIDPSMVMRARDLAEALAHEE